MRTLRDYQVNASTAFDDSLKTNRSALIVMATGLGKTVVMSDICKRWGKRGGVLMLAHRIELLDQAADKFEPDLDYRPNIIQAQRPVDWISIQNGDAPVIIGSVQTLRMDKQLNALRHIPIGLLLVDEAHHATASSYRKISERLLEWNPDLRIGGVTATPNRSDKKALGLVYEAVAYQMDAADGIESGWLVPPCEQRVMIDGVDFSKVKLTTNEFGEADFDPKTLEAVLTEEEPLQAVAQPLLELSRGCRCVVFTAGVHHAHVLVAILNRDREGCAVALDGKNNPPGDPVRVGAIEDFRSGKIQFLVNCGLFTEGFDAPECEVVAIARPTKSLSNLIQMAGRGLRPLPGVVDGLDTAEHRRMAIAGSEKPEANVLYFIPNVANLKVVTVVDALGGRFDDNVVELANKRMKDKPGAQILEELAKAKAIQAFLAAEERRKAIKAKVAYRTEIVGQHDAGAKAGTELKNIHRGGSTDGQIKFLVGLGVTYEKAAGFSRKQAGAVIDKLCLERCTEPMRRTLERFGEVPDVPFKIAKNIIDEIAANGWKPRKRKEVNV